MIELKILNKSVVKDIIEDLSDINSSSSSEHHSFREILISYNLDEIPESLYYKLKELLR